MNRIALTMPHATVVDGKKEKQILNPALKQAVARELQKPKRYIRTCAGVVRTALAASAHRARPSTRRELMHLR